MPFKIIRQDITRVRADAIVNAANRELQEGGGVCGAIFAAAGREQLRAACDAIGHCAVGDAVITPGFGLKAPHIIHTVGPIWRGGGYQEEALLASCYRRSLSLAQEHHLKSIAFPLISSGVYSFTKGRALDIAIETIGSFLASHEMMITLVVFDKATFEISEKLSASVRQFIDDYYEETYPYNRNRSLNRNQQRATTEVSERFQADDDQRHTTRSVHQPSFDESHDPLLISPSLLKSSQVAEYPAELLLSKSLDDRLKHLDETFSQMLLRLIDQKGQTDVSVYRRANLDRRHFSKIRSNPHYQARKSTALALAIALKLSLDETRDLLWRAGYTLSHSSKADLIVEYCIEQGIYDVLTINQVLFSFDQPLLGGSAS